MTDAWPGCHGVRVRADVDLGIGSFRGAPLAEVDIDIAPLAPSAGPDVWAIDDAGTSQRLTRAPDGALTLWAGERPRLHVSADRTRITVDPPLDTLRSQLISSFGLPLVLADRPALAFHAAGVARGGAAVVIAGPGGAGKSSSLIGLIDAGWTPMSEDVCVVDLSGPEARLWPGPPWVRRHRGEHGPVGAGVRFTAGPKTAWDLAPIIGREPVPVVAVVMLDPPGGDAPVRSVLDRPAALRSLAAHAVWLGDPDERGRALFDPVARMAARVPCTRLRLPRHDGWLAQLVGEMDVIVDDA